jgi:hypothetical protein
VLGGEEERGRRALLSRLSPVASLSLSLSLSLSTLAPENAAPLSQHPPSSSFPDLLSRCESSTAKNL